MRTLFQLLVIMKVLAVMALACGLLSIGACSKKPAESSAQAMPQAKPPSVEVSSTQVVLRSLQRSIDVVGTLMADEEAVVSSEVAGPVAEMNVELGSRLSRGQVIARIAPKEFDLRVQQARAALQQARARLGLAGNTDQIDPEQTTDVKQARVALDDARLKFERARQLIANGDISQQRYDDAQVNLRAAEARHQAAVDGVHNQLALVEQRRSELALAEKSLADSFVRAPITGAVSQKMVSRGEYVGVRSPIVSLVKMSPLKLRADIPEMSAPGTHAGQEVVLTADAFPGRTFRGRIARISPALSEKTRAMTIEALIDNKDDTLKPGLFAHVKVLSAQPTPAVMIPAKAVVSFAGVHKAFLIEGRQVAERQLKLGVHDGDMVEVLAGVKPGDEVALSNLERLASGTPVVVKERIKASELRP
ncbi:MAG: efflux RND transporter periplasmic adaptor subunit [Acidobacteria bacterium]|nr:efflux RND transporter periplasmic adaptor subunit [Acidobacteriota bacterium]MBI3655172.1 efflux RND transporter periplasmic adaptor subunit [Acidobacteriota bacterium]